MKMPNSLLAAICLAAWMPVAGFAQAPTQKDMPRSPVQEEVDVDVKGEESKDTEKEQEEAATGGEKEADMPVSPMQKEVEKEVR